jgi:X-Pro dipeptidyl-peptidase
MSRGLTLTIAAVAVALMLALPAAARAQAPYPGDCEDLGSSKVTSPGQFEALPQEVVEIPSKVDGRPLQIGFIRPDAPPGYRAPVIVHASPYHARDLKEADIASCARFLSANFVQHGYAVALVPTRGTGDSDGCPNLFGRTERSDLDDALNWLGSRPWSNGSIAMYGLSYSGSTPWVAAATGNPHLKTIVPGSGVNDLFDLTFAGGTLDWRFWLFVPGYYHLYGPVLHNPAYSGRDAGRTVNAATTCPDLAQGMAATAESTGTGARDSGGYWAERNLRPLVEQNYRGSVLLVQGLQDWNVRPGHAIPWAVSLQGSGTRVHQLLGQWSHAYPDTVGEHTRWDWADRMLAWFDHELKGDGAAPLGASVEVEDSSGRWRRATAWPPANGDVLHLAANGALEAEEDAATASATLAPDSRSRYYYIGETPGMQTTGEDVPVPAEVDETCVTCAVFRMRAAEELRIAGLPEVDVTVTPSAPSGHVTAFLYRKHADGLQRLGYGMTDLRFPAGENSGDEAAEEVVPGVPTKVRIELEPLEGVVGAGEELLLVLGQGRTGQLPGSAPAPVRLDYGAGKSTISLAFVTPGAEDFFTPPGPEGRQLP